METPTEACEMMASSPLAIERVDDHLTCCIVCAAISTAEKIGLVKRRNILNVDLPCLSTHKKYEAEIWDKLRQDEHKNGVSTSGIVFKSHTLSKKENLT